MNVEGGGQAIPFVRSFYGSPSSYLWEDSSGITHTIPHGEGGEQGDPLMPLLFSLEQHAALQAIDSDLNDNEFLVAFLDDVHIVTTADGYNALAGPGPPSSLSPPAMPSV